VLPERAAAQDAYAVVGKDRSDDMHLHYGAVRFRTLSSFRDRARFVRR